MYSQQHNVSKRDKMLPGHSEMSLTVITLYLLQLCTMLGSSASILSANTAFVCSDSNGAQFKITSYADYNI